MQCYYCGVKMTKGGTKKPTSATWDHRIPKSRGGERYGDNRVRACKRCNTKKGPLTDIEFLNGRNPVMGPR
jgi:5-methylcytosine-specific restriction endonuclease McrA